MNPIQLVKVLAVVVAVGAFVPKSAAPRPDEGMWPFDGLPLQLLKEKYDFAPTQEWIDHVRLGSVRFDTGGSGSFVSPNGLVMTNHHVALTTLQKISTPEKDWVEDGFSAKEYGSEVPGEDLTLRQLIEIKDVTKEILAAKKADQTEEGNEWRKVAEDMCDEITDREKHIQADLVPLYDGNQYRIYVYHVYDDVRVVFAPEKQVAFYGGDLDNFTYPRYCLDCAFFRVYEDDKPIDSSKFYFKWNPAGAATDELVFVSGHPGDTDRSFTYAEMAFHRDIFVPTYVKALTRMRDQIKTIMDRDEKAAFQMRDQYFGIANTLKAFEGHLAGLRDETWMERIKARDEELSEKSGSDEVKAAFAFIAAEMDKLRDEYGGDRVNIRRMIPDYQKASERTCADAKSTINEARFKVYGTAMYPDAGFTLRLAFGTVKGYPCGTTLVAPRTTLSGLFERNLGMDNKPPFDLPQHWLDKKAELNLDAPYNFTCTCDIIGGNSGSPILNRDAEVVGLVFDGNIESLPGNYWFDEEINRCVGVHTAGMTEAIKVIYGEKDLLQELGQ